MAKHRLVNCEFINASSFKVGVSNKGKLLYLMMIMNGDDRGFVDSTDDLINALTKNENDNGNTISLDLLENSYNSALNELIEKGYIYEFVDNHQNKVYLIRHWFYHNKFVSGLWTNYRNFISQVHLESNEYVLGKKPLKEDKIKENNTNETILNKNKSVEQKKVYGEDELNPDDYPFELPKELLGEK